MKWELRGALLLSKVKIRRERKRHQRPGRANRMTNTVEQCFGWTSRLDINGFGGTSDQNSVATSKSEVL
jgi:hypothetical protein